MLLLVDFVERTTLAGTREQREVELKQWQETRRKRQVYNYSQLPSYTVRLQLCRLIEQNTAVSVPITFEETAIVMIN